LDAQPIEQSRDLFASAVNQDQIESRAFKLSDLSNQLLAQRSVKKDAAAEFDYRSHQISKSCADEQPQRSPQGTEGNLGNFMCSLCPAVIFVAK
jgi:hypothetical protein